MSTSQHPSSHRSSRRLVHCRDCPRSHATVLTITDFPRPWHKHFIDVGHCRLTKCTKRVMDASPSNLARLPTSLLAMAVKASSAYGPKRWQDELLVNYTQALMVRGMDPNDRDEKESAVALAAYYGY